MPVVDRTKERQIVERARERGMSDDQIKQAILKFRSQAQQPAPEKEKGFLRNVAEDAVRPFAKIGLSGVRAAQSTAATLRGEGATGANRIYDKPANLPFLGETKPLPRAESAKDLLVAAGTGAEAASVIAGGGGAAGVVKSGLKGLIKQGIKTGAKEGATAGFLHGLGSSVQKEDATIGSVAAQTAGETVLGGTGGAVFGAGAPIAGKSASVLLRGPGALGQTFRESAETSIQKSLGATKENLKKKSARLAPEILDRPFGQTFAFTRKGLETKAKAGKRVAGEAFDTVGKLEGETSTKPIIDMLESEKLNFMAGGQVVDENAIARLDKVKAVFEQYGETIENETLRDIRKIFDKKIARAQRGFQMLDDATQLDFERLSSNKIRDILASENPTLAALNKEYNFWSDLDKVISETNLRKVGQQGAIESVSAAAGAISGGTATEIAIRALTFKWAVQAARSPGWRFLSARAKNTLARALMKGDFARAGVILSRAGINTDELQKFMPQQRPLQPLLPKRSSTKP